MNFLDRKILKTREDQENLHHLSQIWVKIKVLTKFRDIGGNKIKVLTKFRDLGGNRIEFETKSKQFSCSAQDKWSNNILI